MAKQTADRRVAIGQLRETVSSRLRDLAYRLRPELAPEGLEYIPISEAAPQSCFKHGVPLEVDVWNTFKGKRSRYYDVLAEQTADADLILLQEFRHDVRLEDAHREMFAQRDAGIAVSFYTERNQAAPTGVCTVSGVRAIKTLFLLSRYYEPVTRTPKMAMCTFYPIDDVNCPLDQSLLVLNSHGINFRLRRPFLDQMLQFEERLRHHLGPIILVGDFNTWERGRVRILEAVTRSLGLSHVRFPPGIKSVSGHELDRVYIRGGDAVDQRVFIDPLASDHSLLSFKFLLN